MPQVESAPDNIAQEDVNAICQFRVRPIIPLDASKIKLQFSAIYVNLLTEPNNMELNFDGIPIRARDFRHARPALQNPTDSYALLTELQFSQRRRGLLSL